VPVVSGTWEKPSAAPFPELVVVEGAGPAALGAL
jgi:hypothetical protein